MPSSLLIQCAEVVSKLDPRCNVMQLDDNGTCNVEGSVLLRRYMKSYRDIAKEMGVKLASEDCPAKAFPPSIIGEILWHSLQEHSKQGR